MNRRLRQTMYALDVGRGCFVLGVAILVMAILTGCTTIGHEPPPSDWPKLEISVECTPAAPAKCIARNPTWAILLLFGGFVPACANVRFDTMQCEIITMTCGGELEKHERQHCAGMDHLTTTPKNARGDKPELGALAQAWDNWKRCGDTRGCPGDVQVYAMPSGRR